jgi:hypothetical protein
LVLIKTGQLEFLMILEIFLNQREVHLQEYHVFLNSVQISCIYAKQSLHPSQNFIKRYDIDPFMN